MHLGDSQAFNDYCVDAANEMRRYLRKWEVDADALETTDELDEKKKGEAAKMVRKKRDDSKVERMAEMTKEEKQDEKRRQREDQKVEKKEEKVQLRKEKKEETRKRKETKKIENQIAERMEREVKKMAKTETKRKEREEKKKMKDDKREEAKEGKEEKRQNKKAKKVEIKEQMKKRKEVEVKREDSKRDDSKEEKKLHDDIPVNPFMDPVNPMDQHDPTVPSGEKKQVVALFPILTSTTSSEWTRYLPWKRFILEDIVTWQKDVPLRYPGDIKKQHAMLKGFKFFSLCPKARVGIRHITIDNRVLHKLLVHHLEYPGVPTVEAEFIRNADFWWNVVFQRSKRIGPKRQPKYFAKTDGVAFSRGYERPGTLAPKPWELKVPGPEVIDIKSDFTDVPMDIRLKIPIVGLDPGKNEIFVTSSGDGVKHSDRITSHMSNVEYRAISGATKRHVVAMKTQYRIADDSARRYPEQVKMLESMRGPDRPESNKQKRKKVNARRRKKKKQRSDQIALYSPTR